MLLHSRAHDLAKELAECILINLPTQEKQTNKKFSVIYELLGRGPNNEQLSQ